MQLQRFARNNGVREGCVAGGGATPVLRTSRDGLRRAGRSRPLPDTNQLWTKPST